MIGFDVNWDSSANDAEVAAPRPRTITVLGMLTVTAFVISYLGAYAVTDALVSANMMQQWHGADPRPRWMLMGFAGLMGTFGAIAILFRILSSRQLRRLDALADETEEFRINDN